MIYAIASKTHQQYISVFNLTQAQNIMLCVTLYFVIVFAHVRVSTM